MPGIQPASLSLLRIYILLLSSIPKLLSSPLPSAGAAAAAAVTVRSAIESNETEPEDTGATFYFDLSVAAVLVLVGGCFAGLTIA